MINSIEAFLEDVEGSVTHAYEDSEGWLTIGIGRLIDKRKGGKLSHDEIMYLLKNDIQKRRDYLKKFAWFAQIDEVRQAVVISMVFQTGGLEAWPKFCNAMAMRDYHEAAKQMLDSKVAKEQAPERWKRQANMMISGEWA